MLKGKKILLGLCGGIAAYKIAYLTRLLIKEGAEVQVIMTDGAKAFIGPLTLATLSRKNVLSDMYDKHSGQWHNHVELGLWPDAMLIAPATANTIAKMAGGDCNNLLLAVYLSARSPVFIAPAMDLDMWQHPTTRKNIAWLEEIGNHIIEPGEGELASGLAGKGRMAEPEVLLGVLQDYFSKKKDSQGLLKDKRVLMTAGPTFEKIDPVRFIGNHSSGKMGIALADELASRGASVTIVCGPVKIAPSDPSIKIIRVQTAAEMYDACKSQFPDCDVFIGAAAVADYTPANPSAEKIKKDVPSNGKVMGDIDLKLVRTKDILAELSLNKSYRQITIGFAMETENELENARKKLEKKKLDFIVLNSLSDEGAGFKHDTNKVTIIDRNNKITKFELKPKTEVSGDIADYLTQLLNE